MISYVIVSWNCESELRQCLASLYSSNGVLQDAFEVVVIDNASTDQSAAMVRECFPFAKLVVNRENQGFARACNQGVQESNGDYVLFLNPDTQPKPSLGYELARVASRFGDHRIVAVGPSFVDAAGEVVATSRELPTLRSLCLAAFGLGGVGGSLVRAPSADDCAVAQLIGAAILMKRSDLLKLGLFDEQFFVYYEEVDLCKRIAERGGICIQAGEIKLVHAGQGSSKSVRVLRHFYLLRSRCLYARKHYGKLGLIAASIGSVLGEPLGRAVFAVACFRGRDALSFLRVAMLLVRWLFGSRLGANQSYNRLGIRQ